MPLSVTDAQRVALEGWVRRRSTAQALALRSRIVLECAGGDSIMEVRVVLVLFQTRSARGVGASWSAVGTDWVTSRGQVSQGRSPTLMQSG